MKKTHSRLLIPGIIMLGIVLRTPFTTLPTVLSDIAAGLGVDVSSLGLLTSLPLLTFAIFSPFAIQFAKRLGIERLFFLVLIVLTVGSAIRTINLPFRDHLNWSWYRLSQCPASKLDPSKQTQATWLFDHALYYIHGDVDRCGCFCRRSHHQSHFLARLGQCFDHLVYDRLGRLDSKSPLQPPFRKKSRC